MNEYVTLKAQYDRLKAKQDGKIAAVALRTAHDKLAEQYNKPTNNDPRSEGYKDGLLQGMILLIQMIKELEKGKD